MKKREDLDLTTIVDQAFNSWLEANAMPGMMGALPPAKIEAMKRSMVGPIYHAIPHIIAALDETPAATEEDEQEKIIASFRVPDSLDGLLP